MTKARNLLPIPLPLGSLRLGGARYLLCFVLWGLEFSVCRSRVNMARMRQSRPDSGLGFQVKILKCFRGDARNLLCFVFGDQQFRVRAKRGNLKRFDRFYKEVEPGQMRGTAAQARVTRSPAREPTLALGTRGLTACESCVQW